MKLRNGRPVAGCSVHVLQQFQMPRYRVVYLYTYRYQQMQQKVDQMNIARTMTITGSSLKLFCSTQVVNFKRLFGCSVLRYYRINCLRSRRIYKVRYSEESATLWRLLSRSRSVPTNAKKPGGVGGIKVGKVR